MQEYEASRNFLKEEEESEFLNTLLDGKMALFRLPALLPAWPTNCFLTNSLDSAFCWLIKRAGM
jgi:hypothetical protein